MNRKEAEVWASIPRGKLKIVMPNLDNHFDVLVDYARGAQVQVLLVHTKEWIDDYNPNFYDMCQYRIKPKQPSKQFKLKFGDMYFIVGRFGDIRKIEFRNLETNNLDINFGNCFKTRIEAEAASERVRYALKGEVIPQKETTDSSEIKLIMEESSIPWKPEIGDSYFVINECGEIKIFDFIKHPINYLHISFGNCFHTLAEAESALERVRTALNINQEKEQQKK